MGAQCAFSDERGGLVKAILDIAESIRIKLRACVLENVPHFQTIAKGQRFDYIVARFRHAGDRADWCAFETSNVIPQERKRLLTVFV